ncbi:MAG: hypothetical protein ACKERG_04655 [Candidatus Hodgkinia cicadicola]
MWQGLIKASAWAGCSRYVLEAQRLVLISECWRTLNWPSAVSCIDSVRAGRRLSFAKAVCLIVYGTHAFHYAGEMPKLHLLACGVGLEGCGSCSCEGGQRDEQSQLVSN